MEGFGNSVYVSSMLSGSTVRSETISDNWNPAFYFMLKALFVFKIFRFFSHFFDHVGKPLDKKAKVNFKIMTS